MLVFELFYREPILSKNKLELFIDLSCLAGEKIES